MSFADEMFSELETPPPEDEIVARYMMNDFTLKKSNIKDANKLKRNRYQTSN